MSKFLLIGSIAAVLYGDCAWGMDYDESEIYENPRKDMKSQSEDTQTPISRLERQKKALQQVNQQLENQTQITQLRQTNFQRSENIESKDRYKFIGNRLYYYKKSKDQKVYKEFATPTTVDSAANDLNGILEIRYANDVSNGVSFGEVDNQTPILYRNENKELKNPKVILYRNEDKKTCYIILRLENRYQNNNNKHGIFYGVNGQNIEMDEISFSVYEVSEDIGSFTNNVSRLIYVIKSSLCIVPAEGNSIEDIIDRYQKEGEFKFKGSIIKVSAIDGSITWDSKPLTASNFFDNWTLEKREVEKQISKKELKKETKSLVVLSTEQPKSEEILRNFYPPKESYEGIYLEKDIRPAIYSRGSIWFPELGKNSGWFPVYSIEPKSRIGDSWRYIAGKDWLNSFVNKRLVLAKAKSKKGAEELVRDGTFLSVVFAHTDKRYISEGREIDNIGGYSEKVKKAISSQVYKKARSIEEMIYLNQYFFRDPDSVRRLKPSFDELEQDYNYNKESSAWLPFEIVRNL